MLRSRTFRTSLLRVSSASGRRSTSTSPARCRSRSTSTGPQLLKLANFANVLAGSFSADRDRLWPTNWRNVDAFLNESSIFSLGKLEISSANFCELRFAYFLSLHISSARVGCVSLAFVKQRKGPNPHNVKFHEISKEIRTKTTDLRRLSKTFPDYVAGGSASRDNLAAKSLYSNSSTKLASRVQNLKPSKQDRRGDRTRRVVANFWQNFGKMFLVFGCIGTDFCK